MASLEELDKQAHLAYCGMTWEEWKAKCHREAENFPMRIPIEPVKGGAFSEMEDSDKA